MKPKILYLLFALLCLGCGKLQFDGMAFFTVKGRLADVNNKSLPNITLQVYNIKETTRGFSGRGTDEAICATGISDSNGNFKITYPKSNGDVYLQLPYGLQMADSVTVNSYYNYLVYLEPSKFNDALIDLQTLKISYK
jgi:hypothetical protein